MIGNTQVGLPIRNVARLVCAVALLSVVSLAGKQFSKPSPRAADTYPAHDEHSPERVSVAVDPYDSPDKANIFSVHYSDAGMLPIYVVITNDGDQPIALANMDAKFVTVDGAKISPAEPDEIYRRLSRPHATSPSPLPWPTKKVKGGVSKQAQEEIQNAQFLARAVEPHSSQAGFMFFDVSDLSTPLAGAHFYLTGLRDASGNELMYFEVPLEKYLSAPAKAP